MSGLHIAHIPRPSTQHFCIDRQIHKRIGETHMHVYIKREEVKLDTSLIMYA